VWFRCVEPLRQDPLTAAAVFVWCSDLELTWTADLPYREALVSRQAASMDHVVHLHRGLVVGDWWLYRLSSTVLAQKRAMVTGQAFPAGRALAATVNQQVLLRMTF
jgi:acyl-CoA thioesterase-2